MEQQVQAQEELDLLEKQCVARESENVNGNLSNVLGSARELLLKLEGTLVVHACGGETPESLLAAMRALHESLQGEHKAVLLRLKLRTTAGVEAVMRNVVSRLRSGEKAACVIAWRLGWQRSAAQARKAHFPLE